MSNLGEPIPKGITPLETTSVSRTRLELARANGELYNLLLDTFLTAGNQDAKKQQAYQLIEVMPSHARNLYREGMRRFYKELEANHALIAEHKGDEAKYLLGVGLRSDGKTEESKIQEVLGQVTPDKIRFIEPTPGVAILEAKENFFRYLQEQGLISDNSVGHYYLSNDREKPSFFIVPVLSWENSSEKGASFTRKLSIRHEFHHLIWNFLQRSKFVREPAEETPELTEAFSFFRDELGAYIALDAYVIVGRAIGTLEPESFVYTKDKEILKKATDAIGYIAACMEIAGRSDVKPATFLYAVMTSRNFAELKRKASELTPPPSLITDVATIGSLFMTWYHLKTPYRPSFIELLKEKGINFSNEALKRTHPSSPISTAYEVLGELDIFKEFLKALGQEV